MIIAILIFTIRSVAQVTDNFSDSRDGKTYDAHTIRRIHPGLAARLVG